MNITLKRPHITRLRLLHFLKYIKYLTFLLLVLALVNFNLRLSDEGKATNLLLHQINGLIEQQNQVNVSRHQNLININNNTDTEVGKIDKELQCILKISTEAAINQSNPATIDFQQCSINYINTAGGSGSATTVE